MKNKTSIHIKICQSKKIFLRISKNSQKCTATEIQQTKEKSICGEHSTYYTTRETTTMNNVKHLKIQNKYLIKEKRRKIIIY